MSALSKIKPCFVALASLGLVIAAPGATADEAATFASSFAVPVFQQIDANGVDLVTGVWRVQTPTISVGQGSDKMARGLQWSGQAWTFIDQPSLWENDGKYTVMYKGASYEFNGFGSGFSKRAPIDGTSLSCDTLTAGSGITYCRFYSREGDYVVFSGFYSGISNFGDKMGLSSLEFGNVGIQKVLVSEAALGSPPIIRSTNNQYYGSPFVKTWGMQVILYGTAVWDYSYHAVTKGFYLGGAGSLILTTPNNEDSRDNHYLRPKNTTQTLTDNFGNVWSYQINNNRDLVAVTQPGGAATVTASYNGDHKVITITTPAGTWNYVYNTSLGAFGSTTVTSPQGEVTYVKYHRDNGYVTEARDALNRTTYYDWNATTKRLDKIRYPEGNAVAFEYDGRGNVTKKTEIAKDGATALTWRAGYPASCPTGGACNQPTYVIDPKGNQTDMEYVGTPGPPTKITYPAADAQSPRKTVINEYSGGRLVRTRTCMTQASCAGTADEVIKEFSYSARLLSAGVSADLVSGPVLVLDSEKVTSGGKVLLTCHQYDGVGRLLMTTPPNANLSSCPTAAGSTVLSTQNPPSAGYVRSAPTFPAP